MEPAVEFISEMFKRGVLVNEDIITQKFDHDFLKEIDDEADLIVLNSDYITIIGQPNCLIDWYDLDRQRVIFEKDGKNDIYYERLERFRESAIIVDRFEEKFVERDKEKGELSLTNPGVSQPLAAEIKSARSVKVEISHECAPRKYTVNDFTTIFLSRYRFLENLLRNRQELQSTLAINRLLSKKDRENVAVIGSVYEINETKNGNLIVTLEDPTGMIKALVSRNKRELWRSAKDLVFDEIVGIVGVYGDKIIFAENIVWPEIPHQLQMKSSKKEEYAVFLSDLHIGSKQFLSGAMTKFLRWINGRIGDSNQKRIAEKVKYIFIAGDLVDGVGVYPSQEEDLEIKDLTDQYTELCRLIRQIPGDKQIIICPGNHDGVPLAEPQPVFYREYAPDLFNLPNVIIVTNPALVNIGKTEEFSGFDVLLYHGFSFDYYVSNVESIRNNGGYHRADLIMQFLLKKRHLAPSFTSTPYLPCYNEDPLLIKKVPDFFLSGHIHYCSVANYRGVTMICGSCWQSKTSYQERLGHEPEPGRVPLVNLKTREVKILKFV